MKGGKRSSWSATKESEFSLRGQKLFFAAWWAGGSGEGRVLRGKRKVTRKKRFGILYIGKKKDGFSQGAGKKKKG